jgi:hypothetical protein
MGEETWRSAEASQGIDSVVERAFREVFARDAFTKVPGRLRIKDWYKELEKAWLLLVS